jgi:hypothetical protein
MSFHIYCNNLGPCFIPPTPTSLVTCLTCGTHSTHTFFPDLTCLRDLMPLSVFVSFECAPIEICDRPLTCITELCVKFPVTFVAYCEHSVYDHSSPACAGNRCFLVYWYSQYFYIRHCVTAASLVYAIMCCQVQLCTY